MSLSAKALVLAAGLSPLLGETVWAQHVPAGRPGAPTLFRPPTMGPFAVVNDAHRQDSTTVVFDLADRRRLTLDFYAEDVVRVFCDSVDSIVRAPSATPPAVILAPHPRSAVRQLDLLCLAGGKAVEARRADIYRVSTPLLILDLDAASGAMTLTDRRTGRVALRTLSLPTTDKNGTQLRLACTDEEYFYGGGVQNGRFSHRGQRIAIENTNNWVDGGVASPTPFYWSTAGYGLLWHTFRPGQYDFGATTPGEVQLSHSAAYADLFLMLGSEPTDLLRQFYRLTGAPVLLPKFGFYQGHLNAYNRDYWREAEAGKDGIAFEDGRRYVESQKDNGGVRESLNGEEPGTYLFSARAAIDRYRQHDMPLGWFLPNDGYGAGYGRTSSLEGNVANLKAFGDYARANGVEIGLWTQSDLHPKEGVEPLLQRDIVREVRDAGVRVLKTDVAWVGWGYSFGLNGVADVAEIMPREGQNARPFILSLDGWAGTQRYAGIWTGDQTGGEWEYIRFHIPTFIGSGLSGQPNISSDTDGIFGGRNAAVNVREFQWKTFTPMELNMDGWGSNEKYPHALGGKTTALNRWYLKFKSELLPYAYTAAHRAIDGWPMVRPMFAEEVSPFTLGRRTQYQFMFGDSFLVAPIYQNTAADAEGNDRRDGIFLPRGTWIDYFTGHRYAGGRVINDFDAPLWKLPLFVKADALIPLAPPTNNPTEIPTGLRIFEVYADCGTKAEVYDDDGRTEAYRSGQSVTTRLRSAVRKDRLTLTIEPSVGDFEGYEPLKTTELRINTTAAPAKVIARTGGRKTTLRRVATREEWEQGSDVWFWDARPELNRWVRPGEESVGSVVKNPQLLVRLAPTDVRQNAQEVEVRGFRFQPETPGLTHHGVLAAPQPDTTAAHAEAYTLTPAWTPVEGADYYEVEFEGMTYSTLRRTHLLFDQLRPDTSYDFRLRAVNADGPGPWASMTLATVRDPLEWAVRGARGRCSASAQGGQEVAKLFDHDLKSVFHTTWGKTDAVPFDLTIDLRGVADVERIEYVPREDAGNGTILRGTLSLSTDATTWSAPQPFVWTRDGQTKTIALPEGSTARYLRLHIDEAVGGYGSGRELFVFRRPETTLRLQGDINRDGRLDDADFTSYLNYTGLRRTDADYDYVSVGDINGNGLIDAYDISCLAVELDGGVDLESTPADSLGAAGILRLNPTRRTFRAGDVVEVRVEGQQLRGINALSFALPYDPEQWEYMGVEAQAVATMTNLTYDRRHTDGTRALYPTFVNRGTQPLLQGSVPTLFTLKFRAKRSGTFNLRIQDALLVDRVLGTAKE